MRHDFDGSNLEAERRSKPFKMTPAQHLQMAANPEIPVFPHQRAGVNGVGEAGHDEEPAAWHQLGCKPAQHCGRVDEMFEYVREYDAIEQSGSALMKIA